MINKVNFNDPKSKYQSKNLSVTYLNSGLQTENLVTSH